LHVTGKATARKALWTSAAEAAAGWIGAPAWTAARALTAPTRKRSKATPCTAGPAASSGTGTGSPFAAISAAMRASCESSKPGGAGGTGVGGGAPGRGPGTADVEVVIIVPGGATGMYGAAVALSPVVVYT